MSVHWIPVLSLYLICKWLKVSIKLLICVYYFPFTLYRILIYFLAPVQSVDSKPSLIYVKVGERVTLNCPSVGRPGDLNVIIWYTQIFGEMPRKVGERLSYTDVIITPEFRTSGLKLEITDKGFSLIIPSMKIENGGLYYCGIFTWDNVTLSRGTFLAVTGNNKE